MHSRYRGSPFVSIHPAKAGRNLGQGPIHHRLDTPDGTTSGNQGPQQHRCQRRSRPSRLASHRKPSPLDMGHILPPGCATAIFKTLLEDFGRTNWWSDCLALVISYKKTPRNCGCPVETVVQFSDPPVAECS